MNRASIRQPTTAGGQHCYLGEKQKLRIKINLNAKLERHKDCYDEEENLTESVFIA